MRAKILRKYFLSFSACLISSIAFVCFSIFLPSKINDPNQLSEIRFGYPFHFIQQNQGWVGYEGDYPHNFTISLDFLDHVIDVKFYKLEFILSILIVWLITLSIVVFAKVVYKKLK